MAVANSTPHPYFYLDELIEIFPSRTQAETSPFTNLFGLTGKWPVLHHNLFFLYSAFNHIK
jgi:hypothetical protein